MRITVSISDKLLPELKELMEQADVTSLEELVARAIGIYIFISRQIRSGLCLALLNDRLEVEGHVIGWKEFRQLFNRHESPTNRPASDN